MEGNISRIFYESCNLEIIIIDLITLGTENGAPHYFVKSFSSVHVLYIQSTNLEAIKSLV